MSLNPGIPVRNTITYCCCTGLSVRADIGKLVIFEWGCLGIRNLFQGHAEHSMLLRDFDRGLRITPPACKPHFFQDRRATRARKLIINAASNLKLDDPVGHRVSPELPRLSIVPHAAFQVKLPNRMLENQFPRKIEDAIRASQRDDSALCRPPDGALYFCPLVAQCGVSDSSITSMLLPISTSLSREAHLDLLNLVPFMLRVPKLNILLDLIFDSPPIFTLCTDPVSGSLRQRRCWLAGLSFPLPLPASRL